MYSLTDVVEFHVDEGSRHIRNLRSQGVEVKKELDRNMPDTFESFNDPAMIEVLGQLATELKPNSGINEVLYRTEYDGTVQRLEIRHNGYPVPPNALRDINSKLDRIARGEVEGPDHGNLVAAQCVKKLGGTIHLENTSGDYTVKTTVEIPYKA